MKCEASSLQLDRLIIEYSEYLRYERKYSEFTILDYLEDIKILKQFLNLNKIEALDITYDDIRNFCNYLDSKKYKNTTIARIISSLRNFYKFLARNKYIKSNPFLLVRSPKKEKRLPKFLYYNELEELFKIPDIDTFFGSRDRLIIELLYATGMRVGELENIKVTDINRDDLSIRIMGKGNKERIVYYGEYAKDILEIYLLKREIFNKKNISHLLLNNTGNKITTNGIRYIIDKIIKKSSLNTKVSPHMLRHTFATHLLNEGCDLLSVQELLGHESIKATQIYTHITNDHLKEVYLHAHPRNRMINKEKNYEDK